MNDMKPIIFNTADIRAILEGRKTVTRRVVKPQPEKGAYNPYEGAGGRISFRVGERGCTEPYKPPYRPGDILYVRETWQETDVCFAGGGFDLHTEYVYKADFIPQKGYRTPDTWYSSACMPREAARIFLRVTDVRVERLQDITEEQARAEGLTDCDQEKGIIYETARGAFSDFWNSTLKPADRARYGWEANPWVWVIGFERISREDAT